jgi:hypothetical protein
MSFLHTLNAYGHVLDAWLSISLNSAHLSSRPRLSWLDRELLHRRIDHYIDPPADASSALLTLYSHYEDALLAMAGADYTADTYRSYYTGSTQEQLLQLNLSLSQSALFDQEGRFLGALSFIDADGRDLELSPAAILADPYTFNDPDRSSDGVVVLLPTALPNGATLQLDLDGDEQRVAIDLDSAHNQRILLDAAVLADLRLQVRDAASSSWLDVPLASVSAAWSELRINIEPSQDLATIPADWQVRLSYDDLLQESISADDLKAGVYLQFDHALIDQIFAAVKSQELAGASLSIGLANGQSPLLSFAVGDYNSSAELYTAIGSAPWVSNQVKPGVLQLQALEAEQGLPAFTLQLSLEKAAGGASEPVYNAAQLVRADGNGWTALDPDGFSLWSEWDGGPVAIDRYGDQLDRLGNQPVGAEPPLWSDYHPWVSITGDLFKPWDEQRTSPKTIAIEGNSFDGGDDLLVTFNLELPDDPRTPDWDDDWRDYVLLFDLFTSSDDQLSEEERNALFDQALELDFDVLAYEPRFTIPVDITAIHGGDRLTATELLNVLANGLADFMASAPAELSGFATPSFSLSSPTTIHRNGRTLLEAVLDFPAPEQGGLKPSVDLWSRVLDDPTNTQAYDEAWELYQTYVASHEQEWLNNYGSRAPQFRSAWTDPLSGAEAADRTITLDFSGLDPLADTYTPGDIRLRLNNKLVDPQLYSVENLWGHQLQITFNPDSGLQLSVASELSISLADGHRFTDTAGIPVAATHNLAVDNWAAWQSSGFHPDGQLLLDLANSYADDKTIRLSFLGSADLSLDSIPEVGDFQFWAYDYNDGTTRALELASTNPLKLDGKALVFSLASSLGSDVSVEVTYDTNLDGTASSAPFTNTEGVAAQAFYWQPIENRSPDKQGPSIHWGSVFGNRLSLGLADPAGVWVGDQELSASNLPAPADFLIKATNTTSGTIRTLTATSISLTPWGWNELELQLDASVEAGETLSLSYQGSSLQDGHGNLAELRQVPINNYSVAYDAGDASSWFQRNDLVKVVFDEVPGKGGFFLIDNGSVSSTADNFQIQDDYIFSLSEISTLTIDLTDKAGGRLDDAGDANLDFNLENLRTQSFIGGSWTSLEDRWLGNEASNDERDVTFVLPAGDYRLSVMHADLLQEIAQSYQLEISHSPFSLIATQLDTNEGELIDTASPPLTESLYLDVLDPGQLTATLPADSSNTWLNLYDLNGEWVGSSTGQSFSQYVLAGLYRLEVGSWSPLPTNTRLSLELDSSISLSIDRDSAQAPSGTIRVNSLPVQGDLNPLDRDDFWTLKLNGGQIYSLRVSGFSDDVNLIVTDAQGIWVADSWNWGSYAEDGSFLPSDETIVIDLSDKAAGTYSYSVQVQTWGITPTRYSLTAKSHADRASADEEAARGVISYDSLFDDFFGDNSDLAGAIDFSQDDLEKLAGLQAVSTDKLRELKASLEKQGFDPSGTVLAFQSTLAGPDPNPVLISKSVPQALPQELRNRLTAHEPGVLSEQQSQLQFGPKQVAALVNHTKDQASGVEPVSKPVGVTVASRQRRLGGVLAQDATSTKLMAGPGLAAKLEGDALGLQRIAIPLDDDTRAALGDPANAAKTLVWYKTPASGEAWLFTYDDSTDTGSRLEDTDPNQEGPDVLALYVQDGGRGDDDGEVNGEIVTPGGLALAQLRIQDLVTSWDGDIDGDGLFSPLSDGLAIARRLSRPDLNDDPLIGSLAGPGSSRTGSEMLARIDEGFNNGHFDLDRSGTVDSTDLTLALRHGFGTFPGAALTAGLELPNSTSLVQVLEQLQMLLPQAEV